MYGQRLEWEALRSGQGPALGTTDAMLRLILKRNDNAMAR